MASVLLPPSMTIEDCFKAINMNIEQIQDGLRCMMIEINHMIDRNDTMERVTQSMNDNELSPLYRPVQQLESHTLRDGVCESGPATYVSSVNLNFANVETIEVSEQFCTDLCMPIPVEASCNVQVDSTELRVPKVTNAVKTWAQVKFEWTGIVPSKLSVPVCPTLTPLTEPSNVDNLPYEECQGQSDVSLVDVVDQGLKLHNETPDIALCYDMSNVGVVSPFQVHVEYQPQAQGGGDTSKGVHNQHDYSIARAKYFYSQGLYAQANQILTLLYLHDLPIFKFSIGISSLNEEGTYDATSDVWQD